MSKQTNYHNLDTLDNDALVKILSTESDTVPRTVIDEFVRRGEDMIYPLWDIIAHTHNWRGNDNKWWAVIHATFIIGAIGGEEAITPLIMSLRSADAHECDWIWEALPSIFGKIGPIALEPLRDAVLDQSNTWMVRSIALDGMAAITIQYPEHENEVFDFIASILKDEYEDYMVRGSAGSILIDFSLTKYEKSLLQFAREEEALAERDKGYIMHLGQEWTIKELASGKKCLDQYQKNWLEFYNKENVQARQKRWKREHSLWYKSTGWWRKWKIRRHTKSWKKKIQ